MCRIIQGNPSNLGVLIARRMVKAVKWSKNKDNNYALPYGKLVCLLIGNECSVPSYEVIDNEPTLKRLDTMAFHKMDFVYDDRMQEWVKKEKPRELMSEDMNLTLMGRFDSEFARLDARLDTEFTRLHERIDDVEAQVWEIREGLIQQDEDDSMSF